MQFDQDLAKVDAIEDGYKQEIAQLKSNYEQYRKNAQQHIDLLKEQNSAVNDKKDTRED